MELLDGVEVFVASVEAGSFAKAAERLPLTRSAIGKTISKIENRLGTRLFHRTTRTQSLTKEGEIYYEHCKKALDAMLAAESLLETGHQDVSGRLRVATSVLFGRRCVAPILLELARKHPLLELELSLSDRPVDVLGDGFDLAIRTGDLGGGNGLKTRRLCNETKVLCASPDYISANGMPKTSAALREHHLLVYKRSDYPQSWAVADDAGLMMPFMPESRLRFDDLEVIVDAALAGMGIAWIPHWLVDAQLKLGDLVPILPALPRHTVDINVVWPAAQLTMPRRVRAAIDALVDQLPPHMNGRRD